MTAKRNEEVLAAEDKDHPKTASSDDDEEFDDTENPSGSTTKSSKESTDEEIDQFLVDAQVVLQDKMDLPENLVSAAEKYEAENKKPKKWKEGGLLVGVDSDGHVKRIEVLPTEQNEKSESLNKALEKAVQKVETFKDAPITKTSEFQFQVRLQGKEIVLRKV